LNRRLLIALFRLCFFGISAARAQAPVTDFSATPTSGCGPLTVQFKDLSTNGPLFWTWDFGNGSSSTLQNPSSTYYVPGTYTVTLIARNKSGAAAARKTNYITVIPYPNALLTADHSLACTPVNVQFTDQSTPGQGSITSWAWTFGDGTGSPAQNPSHSYTQPGYYNIGLTVINSGGCSNTVSYTRYLRVVDGVQPNFNYALASTSCTAPYVVNFINQSAGPGNLSYNWTLGNGAVPANSTDTNPAGVIYPANGNYNVSLLVQSSLGCSQTIQKTLPFTTSTAALNGPTVACVNTPVTFTNASTPPPASMTWDFGDGTGAKNSPATKTYGALGNYSVKLVNKYAGCSDSIAQSIQVVAPPVPAFTSDVNSACKPNLTVQFTDQSTGSPTQWLWDFGDGQTSTQQNPVHSYTATGSFDVKLTVTGTGNCPITTTKTAFIKVQAPTVAINGANTLGACVAPTGSSFTVTPTATPTTVDPVTGYNWSAPGSNEGSSNSATPSFTYPAAGSYTISVTITTAGGCTSAAATSSVQIGTSTPTTFIGPSGPPVNTVCGAGVANFSTPSAPADHFLWDFGDGTDSGPLNKPTATHSYHKPGNYTVTLTLTNQGCPTVSSQIITVEPPLPNFGYKVLCPNPTLVQFTDSSFLNPAPSTLSYTWDYGDATTPDVVTSAPWTPAAPHQYTSPGLYPVTLTITDGSACSPQTITKNLSLGTVTPSFSSPPKICKNQTFTLTSTSTVTPNIPGFIVSYNWQIGTYPGSGTLTAPNYNADIPVNGTYPVYLQVTDINGCVYPANPTTASGNITITGPTAKFNLPSPTGACSNSSVTFTDASTPYDGTPASTITGWAWIFGDGQTANTGPTVSHQYADTGFFHITMTVTDFSGCTDTYSPPDSFQITSPQANFYGPDSFYCPGVPLNFTDSSQGYNLSENWTYGDSQTGTAPSHTYATPGQTYNVTLKVTDKYNCTSTISKTVNIRKPVAAFDIADTTAICTPLETQFTSHSQYYDSLYWAFGDGSTSTLPVTSHFYNTTDTFVAKLYVKGPGGCLDSASRRVLLLNPYLTSKFTFSPLQACDSVPATFSITPPGYTTFRVYFGDGHSDSSGNTAPFHMYRNPSTYGPQLYLTDVTGCIVDYNPGIGITVLGSVPFFSVDKHAFCDSSVVYFTDYTISNDGLATETYTFGDGSPTQSQTPGTGQFNITNDFTKIGSWPVTLKVTTKDLCLETYTDTIKVYQTPHPQIAISSLLCAGLIQFDGSITMPEVDSIVWAWDFGNGLTSGEQNPDVKMSPGNFTVTLKTSSSFGCSDTTSDNITINAIPVIKGPKEITTPLGIPVTIPFSYSNGIVSYVWSPATNLDCPTCPDPVATLILSAQYTVTVTDSNKCTISDTVFIKTLCTDKNYWLPNTFSPNGDGVNDYFYPRGTSLFNVQSLSIFNRWGQMIFQRRDFPANTQNMGWDGNFNGHPAPADAYIYIVEVICDNAQVVAIHGSVTLVR
jgi:gliding motility-associated-like protein